MSDTIHKRDNIIYRFVDGSIKINSINDFEEILAVFPKNPALYRAYADMLVWHNQYDEAAEAYEKSTQLFLDSNLALQAIVSKLFEWQLNKPTHEKGKNFHSSLQKLHPNDKPLTTFWRKLSFPELMAVMEKLERIHIPAGKTTQQAGVMQDSLYLVVSGALSETTFHQMDGSDDNRQTETAHLIENDFWGDIYPFSEEKMSQSQIETITPVELVKIPKLSLKTVSAKHPNIEVLIKELHEEQIKFKDKRFSLKVRKATRYQLPTKVQLEIYRQEAVDGPLVLECFTQNISSTGACVVLGSKYKIGPSVELVGKKVKVQINSSKTNAVHSIFGTILWCRESTENNKMVVEAGIEFNDITSKDRQILENYLEESLGEQELLFDLWETLVK